MSSPRRRAQLGLVAAVMVLGASVTTLVVMPRRSSPIAVASVGTIAPNFQLDDVNGRPVQLTDYTGQTAVLFFGSMHCPKTADYNPRIEKLAKQYAADSRVKFLAIDVSRPGEPADRIAVRVDTKVIGRSFPTLVDEKATLATRYSATSMPTIVVIDPAGVVRYRGPFDDNRDMAFVSHQYCSDALREVLGSPTAALVSSGRVN